MLLCLHTIFHVNYVFYKEEIHVILKKSYDKIFDIFSCDWYMYFSCLRFKKIVAKKFLWQNCLSIVFQMLIRTCSHPPLIETEDMTESNQSEQTGTKVTFKDFIELWDTLFNSPRIKVREPVSLLSHSSVKKNLLQHYIHLCTYQLFSIWVYQLIIFPFWVF